MREEETLRETAGYYATPKLELDETLKDIKRLAAQIRERKSLMRERSRIFKQSNKPVAPRTAPSRARGRSVSDLKENMTNLGVNMDDTEDVIFFISTVNFYYYIRTIIIFLTSD